MSGKIPSVGLISLGCAKNLVDSERLTSALAALGYRIESDCSRCDLVVVNTCGFIGPAVEESLTAVGEALGYARRVIVTGCLGARAQLIKDRYPQVAEVYGPGMRATVIRGIIRLIGHPPETARQPVRSSGVLLTPPHYAYVKIAEGCRHHCSFCVIPALRGPLRSREPGRILAESFDLARRGVRELLIIAQDSSDYGYDLKPRATLSGLMRQLAAYGRWLRVHYVYPGEEAGRLVELMAEGLVLPYLDVPLQHVNPRILRAMKRPGNISKTLKAIESWRRVCPDLAIRSTFITGFPGESAEQFSELLDFLREARLDRVGCFPYSDIDGAAANEYLNPVDEELREERAGILMRTQAAISAEKLRARIGREYQVLIDYAGEDGRAVGRSKYEAPDVDGVISVSGARSVRPGDLVRVRITGADEHDLQGELIAPDESAIAFRPL